LRCLARAYLRKERGDHTPAPTALVHEAYIRLAAQHTVDWENSIQVKALAASTLAASMMRRILSDYAAGRKAAKRPAAAFASLSPKPPRKPPATTSICRSQGRARRFSAPRRTPGARGRNALLRMHVH
jgi:hypothetical protein